MSIPHRNEQQIQLWYAASSSDQPGPMESACETWLIDEEIERADRFRVATSRNQHVVGRGMARQLLGGDAIEPDTIRFDFQPHGKPFVAEPESARQPFNVAHTDGLVMCGIGAADDWLLGVDVERVGRRTDPALADRFFSEPEIRFLQARPDEESRRNAFLRIWTLKESFIKAIGTGLQTPLADFAFVDIDAARPQIELLNPKLQDDRDWHFFSVEPRPGFIAAVAVGCPDHDRSVSVELKRFDDQCRRRHP